MRRKCGRSVPREAPIMRGVAAGRSVCAQRKERLAAGGTQRSPDPSASAPNCANQLDRPDQLVELCRTAVPQEIAYLRHRERDDAPLRIVEPGRAIAAWPAVAAGDWPVRVGLGDNAHAEPPAAAAEDRPAP